MFLLRSLSLLACYIFSGTGYIFRNRWHRSRSFFTSFPTGKKRAENTHLTGQVWSSSVSFQGQTRIYPARPELKEHLNGSQIGADLCFNKLWRAVTSRVFARPLFGDARHLFGFLLHFPLFLRLTPSPLRLTDMMRSLNAYRAPLYEWSVDSVSSSRGWMWTRGDKSHNWWAH